MNDEIVTSAEALENDILPKIKEVHTTDQDCPSTGDLPKAMKEPAAKKSPAQWAYERIILYIQNFEKQLDSDHEVGLGFVGGDAGVMKIEGLGYFDPDIVTYYGTNGAGAKTQLVQHVSQLNVMLVSSPKRVDQAEPNRIGFQLASALERDAEDAAT
ncbi:DUF6173 family protein [Loktanella sp. F6476L]|uniref:DUF6173 family protein n=1 Tax=Loktanella sp. F6476L TaxID=2926405 RepID=UPI001FF1E65B|nr:DUF6173 family protein [Loktanella sp. F6476L]MCK0121215.1 DUF6173 family protein [Loktanella sp. F6476L]UWQ99795.1 hypothetical protein K3729_03065 [Rhodobacteraceae bacterium S2214]